MPVSGVGHNPEQMLRLAQAGGGQTLGQLLELYRNYLTLLARLQMEYPVDADVTMNVQPPSG